MTGSSNRLLARWESLSTGLKMFLIMSLGLLPLGLIAVWTSLYSAAENSEQRIEQTLVRLDTKAQRLNELLTRTVGTVRAASAAIDAAPRASPVCERILQRLDAGAAGAARYAFYDSRGVRRCATKGFAPTPSPGSRPEQLEIQRDGRALQLSLYDGDGTVEAIVEFSRDAVADVTYIPGTSVDFNLALTGDGRGMMLQSGHRRVSLGRTVRESAPIGDGDYRLHIELAEIPIRPLDLFVILLPVIMWVMAATIAWFLVNRLLLKPLARMHKVVAEYKPGDMPLVLPAVRSPAREIAAFGDAFDQAIRTVARHESDLESAVDRQTRLVREVHHRVKNNLQVVASLLNLHSRGAASEEVAAAYASIQRRVDALAVVHRNHYAELEENRGVALKSLLSELAANLRATAPASASGMQIRLDIAAVHVSQDTAVSVAFLVTEIVEVGMLEGASLVSIVLERTKARMARLSVEVDSLADDDSRDETLKDRFDRIIIGLARQLRSPLEREPARGRYSVVIAVTDSEADTDSAADRNGGE